MLNDLRPQIELICNTTNQFKPSTEIVSGIIEEIRNLKSKGNLANDTPSWEVESLVDEWCDEILSSIHDQYKNSPFNKLGLFLIRGLGIIFGYFLLSIQFVCLLGTTAYENLSLSTDWLVFLRGAISQVILTEWNFGIPINHWTQLLSIMESFTGIIFLTVAINLIANLLFEKRSKIIEGIRHYVYVLMEP